MIGTSLTFLFAGVLLGLIARLVKNKTASKFFALVCVICLSIAVSFAMCASIEHDCKIFN
jgi:hypothetical protein